MRSAFIIASFALTLLAAPVQVTKGQAPAVAEIVAPTEVALDARWDRDFYGEGKGSRSGVEKRQNRKNYRSEEAEAEDVEAIEKRVNRKTFEKRQNRKNYRSEQVKAENEAEDVKVVEKRQNRKNYRSEEAKAENEAEDVKVVEKRQNRKNYRSEAENETEDVEVVEKRFNRQNSDGSERTQKHQNGKNYRSEEETGVAKGINWIKPVARNVYNNMAGIIEALKTRGFSSANFVLPAREVV